MRLQMFDVDFSRRAQVKSSVSPRRGGPSVVAPPLTTHGHYNSVTLSSSLSLYKSRCLPVLGDDGLSLRVRVGYVLLLLVAFLGNLSSRIYLSGSPVPSFLPREPKPLAVVTFRGEGSIGLAHDYLYSRTSASLRIMAEPFFAKKKRAEHFGQRVRTYVTHPEPAKANLHRS